MGVGPGDALVREPPRGLAEQDGIARQANDQVRPAVGGDPVEALGGAK
jgi:hypothetical protein